MKLFRLEVITPERTVFDGDVQSVMLPAESGAMSVLAGHAPLVATLETGAAKVVKADGGRTWLMLGDGFVEVTRNHVRVLADVGEPDDAIDVKRAEESERRARERLKARAADVDLVRAEAALARALVRKKIVRDLRPVRDARHP
jgi:F-type H+-transporting ATPase subunit epsilon